MLIDFLGDSITEGAGASSQDKCFVERVKQLLEFKHAKEKLKEKFNA